MKLIIDNRSSISDMEALELASCVVSKGKGSVGRYGRQYCHVMQMNDHKVFTIANKNSQRFVIVSEKSKF